LSTRIEIEVVCCLEKLCGSNVLPFTSRGKNMVILCNWMYEGPKPSISTLKDVIRKILMETVGLAAE